MSHVKTNQEDKVTELSYNQKRYYQGIFIWKAYKIIYSVIWNMELNVILQTECTFLRYKTGLKKFSPRQ